MIHTIGMLIPATNAAVEIEMNRVLPKHYQVHVGRLRVGSVDAAGWAEQDADIDYQAALLGTLDPAVIILLQTSASFFGEGYDDIVTRRIEQHSGGAPALTTAQAMVAALHAMHAGSVALVSPYSPAVISSAARYFGDQHGFEVTATQSLNITDPSAISQLRADPVTDALERASDSDPDVLIVAGGAFRGMDSIHTWETRFGRPVITTNQVAMWAALRAVNGADRIAGYGRLLERPDLSA